MKAMHGSPIWWKSTMLDVDAIGKVAQPCGDLAYDDPDSRRNFARFPAQLEKVFQAHHSAPAQMSIVRVSPSSSSHRLPLIHVAALGTYLPASLIQSCDWLCLARASMTIG